MALKYALPDAIAPKVDQTSYQRWLDRKARAHLIRDRRRGNTVATRESYMLAIHRAVCRSGGLDEYTGRPLRWEMISAWDNDASKKGGRAYKQSFGDLPTVDHVDAGLGEGDFAICSWRINDVKSDLDLEEFLEVCRDVLAHADRLREISTRARRP